LFLAEGRKNDLLVAPSSQSLSPLAASFMKTITERSMLLPFRGCFFFRGSRSSLLQICLSRGRWTFVSQVSMNITGGTG
jgi:hypothetical protein